MVQKQREFINSKRNFAAGFSNTVEFLDDIFIATKSKKTVHQVVLKTVLPSPDPGENSFANKSNCGNLPLLSKGPGH